MFFTVVSRSGANYDTNHITPGFSEADQIQQVSFFHSGRLQTLPVSEVEDIKINKIPYPVRSCACCL